MVWVVWPLTVSRIGIMWLYVAICGFMWQYVALCGFMWLYVAICGFMWQYVALCGFMWQYVALCGFMWQYVALCGNMWLYVAICGFMLISFLLFFHPVSVLNLHPMKSVTVLNSQTQCQNVRCSALRTFLALLNVYFISQW